MQRKKFLFPFVWILYWLVQKILIEIFFSFPFKNQVFKG